MTYTEVLSDRINTVCEFKMFKFKQSLLDFGKPELFRDKIKSTLLKKQTAAQQSLIDNAVAKAKAAPVAVPARGILSRLL